MDSFGARAQLTVEGRAWEIFRLDALERRGWRMAGLPFASRVLLEGLLRHEDGTTVSQDHIEALATSRYDLEIPFYPARVLLQDLTGVPVVADLAAVRDAVMAAGGDAHRVNTVVPADLVIDHSIQVDAYGTPDALGKNEAMDYARNGERYALLRWARGAFPDLRVIPPNRGICHQVHLEQLARLVGAKEGTPPKSFLDTAVGTDSHTPMVAALGVLAWGVGGIEAEAALLGQPLSLPIPKVIGLRLDGRLRPGVTATDLVLTLTEKLRKAGVVGRIVEVYGPGVATLAVPDRAAISNMSPEYGATVAIFPPDAATLAYMRLTGRTALHLARVEAHLRAQGMLEGPEPDYPERLELDLASVGACVAGPRRPQERVPLEGTGPAFAEALPELAAGRERVTGDGIRDGTVVIAAITSCTNTSNPSVMLAAGLLARNAAARGLRPPAWVKTSLAPGSTTVSDWYRRAGLWPALESLGFDLVAYGCTTCIGNSGPLSQDVSDAIAHRRLVTCAVLSGNRNFEGRIHPEVRASWLMSPPLVVAFALAGRIDVDLTKEPLGTGTDGKPVYLREIWPDPDELARLVEQAVRPEAFVAAANTMEVGDPRWDALPSPTGDRFAWDPDSTYIRRPPFLEDIVPGGSVHDARVLVLLGDGVTTDHISPAGSIARGSPAALWLTEHGVPEDRLHSYGARRGNHEVMVRGTFANVRLRNRMVPGVEGGFTRHVPSGDLLPIFDAAMRYRAEGTPLVVIAGKEYGSGSSRDWAAKGTALLGVRAVIAESFERIHRSNLLGMGILPLQVETEGGLAALGLDGSERLSVEAGEGLVPGASLEVHVRRDDGRTWSFPVRARLDSPRELAIWRAGGLLPYGLRALLHGGEPDLAGGMKTASRPKAEPSEGCVEEASLESFPASDPPTY